MLNTVKLHDVCEDHKSKFDKLQEIITKVLEVIELFLISKDSTRAW